MVSELGLILIYIIVGAAICLLLYSVSKWLAPSMPSIEKQSTYECGEEHIGNSWSPISSRFYIIALLFLLFDIEVIFIFPWSVVFANKELIAADGRWGWMCLMEMFSFLIILLVGLVYIWKLGHLTWLPKTRTKPTTNEFSSKLYEQINLKKHTLKPFSIAISETDINNDSPATDTSTSADTSKPAFRPMFRKKD